MLAALQGDFMAPVNLLFYTVFSVVDAITLTKVGKREARPATEKMISSLVWDIKCLVLLIIIIRVSTLIGSSR